MGVNYIFKKPPLSVSFTGFVLAVIFTVSGCSSSVREDEFTKEMKQKFAAMNDPGAAIEKAREYALDKLSDASDTEIELISTTAPVIGHNSDESEYSFTWKGKKGEENIEVLSTPPPCEPIAVFRVSRIYYP